MSQSGIINDKLLCYQEGEEGSGFDRVGGLTETAGQSSPLLSSLSASGEYPDAHTGTPSEEQPGPEQVSKSNCKM